MRQRFQHVIVACARWEAEYITEWLIYHRHIGFDHVYLYCNDDDPAELYEAVLPFVQGPEPFLTFYHFGLQGQQEQMYRHFLLHHAGECEWFTCIDIDEFLLMGAHDHVGEFISSLGSNPDAILLHSCAAGNNGHVSRPSGLAVKNFTRRAAEVSPFTKALVRRSSWDPAKMSQALSGAWHHHVEIILKDDSRIVNVLDEDARGYYKDFNASWAAVQSRTDFHPRVLEVGFLFHFCMKSEEDMMRRFRRGTKGDFETQDVWRETVENGPEAVARYFAINNAVEDRRLADAWDRMLKAAYSGQIVAPPPGKNLALGGAATQSSISEWSRHPEIEKDAAGVIDGDPGPRPHHHTSLELDPWWTVDLGRVQNIGEIRIFNRVDDVRDRFRNFRVLGSVDGSHWDVLFAKHDDQAFGGVDGFPHIWTTPQGVAARWIRVQGEGLSVLDLAQVEVYGFGPASDVSGSMLRVAAE